MGQRSVEQWEVLRRCLGALRSVRSGREAGSPAPYPLVLICPHSFRPEAERLVAGSGSNSMEKPAYSHLHASPLIPEDWLIAIAHAVRCNPLTHLPWN